MATAFSAFSPVLPLLRKAVLPSPSALEPGPIATARLPAGSGQHPRGEGIHPRSGRGKAHGKEAFPEAVVFVPQSDGISCLRLRFISHSEGLCPYGLRFSSLAKDWTPWATF